MLEVLMVVCLWFAPVCGETGRQWLADVGAVQQQRTPVMPAEVGAGSVAEDIISAAKLMVEISPRYRFDFPQIEYPLGDPSASHGLCCDVVVRACRAAGIDLQQLVYEDSLRERTRYIEANRYHQFARPLNRSWVHRRTANLNLFLQRYATSLSTRFDPAEVDDWRAGDIVIYRRNGRLTWHIAIVSDERDPARGIPLVVDAWSNPGYVSQKHRVTDHGEIGGRYRFEDGFRDSLPEEHRTGAVLAWERYLESSGYSGRLADSSHR